MICCAPYAEVFGPICEAASVNLTCADGQVVDVVHAEYSAAPSGACGGPVLGDSCRADVTVEVSAIWAPRGVAQLLLQAGLYCNNEVECRLIAENSVLGGDPCSGSVKQLEGSYQCVDCKLASSLLDRSHVPRLLFVSALFRSGGLRRSPCDAGLSRWHEDQDRRGGVHVCLSSPNIWTNVLGRTVATAVVPCWSLRVLLSLTPR